MVEGRGGFWVRYARKYLRLYNANELPAYINELKKRGAYIGSFDLENDPLVPFIRVEEYDQTKGYYPD
jgi:hypothetical protein